MAAPPEAVTILRRLGWRIRTTGEAAQAVQHFQGPWMLGRRLKVDGLVGPKTLAALRVSEARRKRGLPTASPHFSFVEFRCKCGGRHTGCARIWVTRGVLLEVERYRRALGHGVSIVSGCRCTGHNLAVKGASQSKHMTGEGVDFPPVRSVGWFRSGRLFSGLGYNPLAKVRHGDTGRVRSWRYGS
jgi:hypothetical protein